MRNDQSASEVNRVHLIADQILRQIDSDDYQDEAEPLREALERLIGTLYLFQPDKDMTEEQYEFLERNLGDLIDKVRKIAWLHPSFPNMADTLTEFAEWIARGYSPSRPPTSTDIEFMRAATSGDIGKAFR